MKSEALSQRRTVKVPMAIQRHWPLIVGFLVLAIPTLVSLGEQSWSTELGAHGPIVLATGVWLLFHSLSEKGAVLREKPSALGLIPFVAALPLYAFSRAFDFISLEVLALYVVAIALAWHLLTPAALRIVAFPLLYLGFLIPPPGWVIDQVTAPLQQFVSWVVTGGLAAAGYPIVNSGVTIFIAQYQLLVEQACAGMNSIVGLVAIMMFYIYLMHRSSWRYTLFMMMLILPIAIIANILRVATLVLITYYMGDAAAQGFLHVTTGVVLFGIALLIAMGLDGLFQSIGRSFRNRAVAA